MTGHLTTPVVNRYATPVVNYYATPVPDHCATLVAKHYLNRLRWPVILSWGFCCWAHASDLTPLANSASSIPPSPWHIVGLPEKYAKPVTQFDITPLDGKRVLRVRADKSYGNLVHPWNGPASSISFKWRLDTPLLRANIKTKAGEDIALKVCLSFDLPADKIPAAERLLFKIAQLASPEPLPTATLCYVWDHSLPVDTGVPSPYTNRLHYIVLDSGETQLKTWHEHQRNVSADFLKAFGKEVSTTPAVTAIIIGADSDNTGDSSLGYVADITVQP